MAVWVRTTSVALLLGLLQIGCASDSPDSAAGDVATDEETSDAEVGDVAQADAGDAAMTTDADARPDAVEDSAADTDAEDTDADVTEEPDCEPPLRPVGSLCRRPFDRACLDSDDCRPDEECVWGPDDTRDGTCIYTPAPPLTCPGAPGCEPNEGAVLRAAFGARDVTPQGWEVARPGYSEDFDSNGNPRKFVGDVTDPTTFCDCGRDGICPPGEEYGECPSEGAWLAPDADGTEGDGYMQGNWIAGFNEGRNAGRCPAEWTDASCVGAHCCASEAYHDPMWVRGAVLDFGDTRVAFLTIDAVGYFYNDIQRHLAAFPDEWEIDHLVMTSTHTHQASDTMGRWGPGVFGTPLPTDSGRVPAWLDEVHEAVVDLVGDTVSRLTPVDAYFAQFRTPRDTFALRDSRDPYVAADVATAIRLVESGQEPSELTTLGVWLNWHNHAEAVGSRNPIVSSDFPHWFRQGAEDGLPALGDAPPTPALGGVAVYLAGAVGGLMTPLRATAQAPDGEVFEEDGFEKARALGHRLASTASAAFTEACGPDARFDCFRPVTPNLAFSTSELLLDLENVNFQTGAIDLELFQRPVYNWRRSDGSGFRSDNLPKLLTAVTRLRLGEVTLQTIPGEPFPETFTGFELDEAARWAQVGDERDLMCEADGLTRGPESEFACLNDEDNAAPPDLSEAPDGPGLFDAVPGQTVVPLGNGMDSVGYFIPSYDFSVHPDFGVLVPMPGDHYEEEVSVGDALPELLELIDILTAELRQLVIASNTRACAMNNRLSNRRPRIVVATLCLVVVMACSDDEQPAEGPVVEELNASALDADARIRWDANGIAHIEAATVADAYFLQGWVTARDRMFQMDLSRRRAWGTRAEVLGADFLDSDVQSRALLFGEWGRRTRAALETEDPEALSWFLAYTAGVNAWLDDALSNTNGAELSPQFAALGYAPRRWEVEDSLAIEKMLAAGLSMRVDQDVILGLFDQLLGRDLFVDVYRYHALDREYVVPDFGDAAKDLPAPEPVSRASTRDSAVQSLRSTLSAVEPSAAVATVRALESLRLDHGGSNNWVVSGDHTVNGFPVLAGDSHQGIRHPAVYYFVHLNAGGEDGFDVIGASFPGVPTVVFGHNGVAGVMPTTSIYDATDVYLETVNRSAETVLFEGEQVAMLARDEEFSVRPPGGPVEEAERTTLRMYEVPHHGPILPADALGLPIPLDLSVRWTGYRPISLARTFHGLARAQDFSDFRRALEHYSSGGMHWLYADTNGHIGYSSRVDLPLRETVDAETPPTQLLPGEGGFEWLDDGNGGFQLLSDDQLPWTQNPPSGFLSTANNDPVGQTDDNTPFDEPVYLSGIFDIGTRARQPRRLFEAAMATSPDGRLTVDDIANMQLDTTSRISERVTPFLLDAAARRPDLVGTREAEAVAILRDWDHRCEVDSAAAVIFHGWLALFARDTLGDERGGLVGSLVTDDLDARLGLVVAKFLVHWLETTGPIVDDIDSGELAFPSESGIDFWDDKTTSEVETRDEIMLGALRAALDELEGIFLGQGMSATDAATPSAWRWGDWHVMQLVDYADHVLPSASSAALPKAGCLYTVDVADFQWLDDGSLPQVLTTTNAASDRFVLEMRPDGVVGRAILPGGQDERPGALHHNDQFAEFVAGQWRPLPFREAELSDAAVSTREFPSGFGNTATE